MMKIQENRALLKQLTEKLIGSPGMAGQWFLVAQDLYQLLLHASGLDTNALLMRQDLQLQAGKALAPVWAAHCIKDFLRTRTFLRGTLQAIEATQLQFPGTPLHVLYAGTGPFATLALPLIPLFDPEKVQFTFLEISPQSISALEKVVQTFGFEPWVREIVCADATTYQVDADTPVHLVISEMMQAGLRREPQVAACLNLAPQIAPGGCMIPQKISVKAGLLHPHRDMERMIQAEVPPGEVFQLIGTVFELSMETVLPSSGVFDVKKLEFSADCEPGFTQLALFTEIQVFESEYLHCWDSGLTQPVTIQSWTPDRLGQKIDFQYQLGNDPGFQWQVKAEKYEVLTT